jgi:hypothetical protein
MVTGIARTEIQEANTHLSSVLSDKAALLHGGDIIDH